MGTTHAIREGSQGMVQVCNLQFIGNDGVMGRPVRPSGSRFCTPGPIGSKRITSSSWGARLSML